MNFVVKKYIMRFFSCFIVLICFSFLNGQVKLDSVFNEFKKDKSLQFATISFLVKDLTNDTTYLAYNDSISIVSASTVKLFSTASAIEILGKDFRPKTNFYIDKLPDTSGVVYGDLYIKGGADISFASQYFTSFDSLDKQVLKVADTLSKLGIRVIRGNLIGDGSAFGYQGAPDGWAWEDLGNYYGAFPSGLSIYDNILKFQFYVGAPRTKPILLSTFPVIPNLTLRNTLFSANGVGDNSWIYGGPYSYERSIRGSLGAYNKSFIVKGSLPDPEMQFLQAMKEAFNKKGIILEGNLIGVRQLPDTIRFNYTSKKNVCSHFGASVKEIAYWTNLKSINVFAETLNSWIGYEKTGLGTTENGVKSIQDYWKGKIYTDGLNLTDGSGLSRSNSVSARNFCSLLQYMYFSKNQEAFLSTLPVTGQSGTLTYFCKGQCSEGKIQAKSGTMKRVKSYAGYVSTTSGKKLTFALIVNNYNCSNTTIMKKMESLMNAMYLQ